MQYRGILSRKEIFRTGTVKNSGRSYLLVHLLRILVSQGSSTPRGASCYHANHWWRHFLLPRATLTVNFVFKHGVGILKSTKAITRVFKTCFNERKSARISLYTYIRNGVEFGNLTDFSRDETELFEVYLLRRSKKRIIVVLAEDSVKKKRYKEIATYKSVHNAVVS